MLPVYLRTVTRRVLARNNRSTSASLLVPGSLNTAIRCVGTGDNHQSPTGTKDSKDAGDGAGLHGDGHIPMKNKDGAGASFAKDVSSNAVAKDVTSVRGESTVYLHTKLTEAMKAPAGVASSAAPTTSWSSASGRVAGSASSSVSIPLSSRHKQQPVFLHAKPSKSSSSSAQGGEGKDLLRTTEESGALKTAARSQDGPTVPDYGPMRQTGLWTVDEVLDEKKKTVDFRRIDDVESEIIEELKEPEEALVPYEEEERWKHHLMFVCKFKKTPKHLTWKELGEEIQCMDCTIDLDEHRPEEIFTINFYFTDKKTGTRDIVWSARNDVAHSEGFTDLLAALGACLGRSDVHRTIRFDDGLGTTRDLTFRKRSRYTSDIQIAFRPAVKYNKYQRKEEQDEYEDAMEAQGMSTWGYHPSLMDPEYNELDFEDPEGTYEVALSAHGLCFIILRAIRRLLARPMKELYRPSQLMRTAKVRTEDDIGFAHAMAGWMGVDEQIYPHYTPIDALQDHWLGKDAPFSLCAIVNKLREMAYLKKENPELQSWLSVRHHDTHLAIRNMGVKLLGVGASTLFVPVAHNSTVNRLLPKGQQRRLESKFSLNAVLGLPDETRRLDEFKQITGHARLGESHKGEEKSKDYDNSKSEVQSSMTADNKETK